MNIDEIVNELLKNVPYSKSNQRVRNKIRKSLQKEYNKYLENHDKLESLMLLLQNYKTLESACLLAGYNEDEIQKIIKNEKIISHKEILKTVKKFKHQTLTLSIFLVLVLSYILLSLVNSNFLFLIPLIILIPVIIILIKNLQKSKLDYNTSLETYEIIQEMEDKYHKKTLNSVTLGISLIFFTISFLLKTNYKWYEIINQIMSNLLIGEIILICILKNIINNKVLNNILENENEKKYKSHLRKIVSYSIVFWSIIVLISYLLPNHIRIIFSIISLVIYFILYLIYTFKIRKKIIKNNIIINKKRLTLITVLIISSVLYYFMRLDSWLLQPYINSIPSVETSNNKINYNYETGVYEITAEKDTFKILQLTDIHLGGSGYSVNKDKQALYTIYKLIENTKPDLVIITGDLVFPLGVSSMSFNNKTPIMQFASFMRNIGVPWAFAYGNHDTESIATSSKLEVNELLKSLSYRNSKNLLYPYMQPNITGRNNQLIEIKNKDGKLIQALFILDSNSYTNEGKDKYDYIHDDQVDWYEEKVKELSKREGYIIPSMIFFHMPLNEYKDAYNLYKQKSPEVTYHFGEIGELNEEICDSEHHSKLFDRAVSLKSTKAMFCGHDHYNNISLTYKGIRLTYGLSIDYLVMPKIHTRYEQRGGTLITINDDGDFDIEQIKFLDIY